MDWLRQTAICESVSNGEKEKASMITPVPGGVGPMTITMLYDEHGKNSQTGCRNPGLI